MHLTEHTDFGLRVLLLLAHRNPQRQSVKRLATEYEVSYPHLQKVVQNLAGAGFVETHRGRGGGVQLARDAEDICVGDVVRALEPHLALVPCLGPDDSCAITGGCGLTEVFARARRAMLAELDRATLADVTQQSPALILLPRTRA